MGERRQLTSMFCDLVASTPLSLRLDPEDFSEVIRVFQDTCAGVITRGSGYVARYQGDGVLACFGYPRAREDDAQSAARAALDIVANIGQLRTPDGEPLCVRVGIATGLVVVVGESSVSGALEHSIVGETLNLAARLQSVAGPGESSSRKPREDFAGRCSNTSRGATSSSRAFRNSHDYRLLGEGSAQSRFDARTLPASILSSAAAGTGHVLLLERGAGRLGQIGRSPGEPGTASRAWLWPWSSNSGRTRRHRKV